jgi:cytochrome c biogenesis protein CcdA
VAARETRSVLTLVIWALGLLTPLAFAAAVWKYNVLAISAE